jgi:hypothetical protein
MRWGEVPRYWKGEQGQRRWGYTRDGTPHAVEVAAAEAPAAGLQQAALVEAPAADAAPSGTDAAEEISSDVLTKTGFRAIAVIFNN